MDENWKLARRHGIGGSDVAAILGLSPFRKPIDVWLEKKGLLDDQSDANREFLLQLGHDLEPVISKLYERQTEKKLILPFPMQWQHAKYPVLLANPDRFIEGESKGVELKTESQYSDRFGDPGTDQVPPDYLLQVAHYMNVMGYETWDVAVLHAGTRFATYTVKRDKELESAVTEKLLEWWENYIVKDTPPEVDGSLGWTKFLKKKFPANVAPLVRANEEQSQLVDLLVLARMARDKYGAHVDEIENRLKFAIGENEGFTGRFGRLTWRKTKDSESVDWELTFKDFVNAIVGNPALLVPGLAIAEIAQTIQGIHTVPRQGSRRLLLTAPKGQKYGASNPEDRNLPAALGEIQEGDSPRLAETSERGAHGQDRPHIVSKESKSSDL